MKTLILTLLLLLLFAPGEPVAAQALRSSASGTADRFYRTYLKLQLRGLPNEKELKVLSPLITSDLKQLFVAAMSEEEKFVQEHPDEKPPWGDGDLFTSLFEGAQSFRLGTPIKRGGCTEVPVHLAYSQGGSTTRWSDVLVLVRTQDGWRVWDILLQGEWAFKNGPSLRKVLSSK
jgi:hypothetical protein